MPVCTSSSFSFFIFFFSLLFLFLDHHSSALYFCQQNLGMHSFKIRDERLSASSHLEKMDPQAARVRLDLKGGAWCPKNLVSSNASEFLEVDLERLHVISIVETQGRFAKGQGQEFVSHYYLDYQRGKTWFRFKDTNGNELFEGNSNTHISEMRLLDKITIATKLRFRPFSKHPKKVCLRVELHGCLYEEGILSYSIPQGEKRGHELDFSDFYYDGEVVKIAANHPGMGGKRGYLVEILRGGLGQLVDGHEGHSNIRLDLEKRGRKGHEWVGWKIDSFPKKHVDLIFQFDSLRNFSLLLIHSNNMLSKEVALFSKIVVYFGNSLEELPESGEEGEDDEDDEDEDDEDEEVQTKEMREKFDSNRTNQVHGSKRLVSSNRISLVFPGDSTSEEARNVSVPLQQTLASIVLVRLFFAAKWLLVSEVYFISEKATNRSWTPGQTSPPFQSTPTSFNNKYNNDKNISNNNNNLSGNNKNYNNYNSDNKKSIINNSNITDNINNNKNISFNNKNKNINDNISLNMGDIRSYEKSSEGVFLNNKKNFLNLGDFDNKLYDNLNTSKDESFEKNNTKQENFKEVKSPRNQEDLSRNTQDEIGSLGPLVISSHFNIIITTFIIIIVSFLILLLSIFLYCILKQKRRSCKRTNSCFYPYGHTSHPSHIYHQKNKKKQNKNKFIHSKSTNDQTKILAPIFNNNNSGGITNGKHGDYLLFNKKHHLGKDNSTNNRVKNEASDYFHSYAYPNENPYSAASNQQMNNGKRSIDVNRIKIKMNKKVTGSFINNKNYLNECISTSDPSILEQDLPQLQPFEYKYLDSLAKKHKSQFTLLPHTTSSNTTGSSSSSSTHPLLPSSFPVPICSLTSSPSFISNLLSFSSQFPQIQPSPSILPPPISSLPEIERSSLRYLSIIGEGKFGQVYLCELTSTGTNAYATLSSQTPICQGSLVAVKVLFNINDVTARSKFENEMNLMNSLKNKNLNNLIGWCLKDSPTCLVYEYLIFGDLKNFLVKIGSEKLKNKLKDSESQFSVNDDLNDSSSNSSVNSDLNDTKDNITVLASTKTTLDKKKKKKTSKTNNWLIDDSKCHQEKTEFLNSGCFLFMANQISSGMSHLEDLGLVHRDLSARNCLVGENFQIKVSDLGTSHFIYPEDYFSFPSSDLLVPGRWMAWEALLLGKFTNKSDVWSFGMTFWEMFKYCLLQPLHQLSESQVLKNNELMKDNGDVFFPEKPENCPREVYDLMRHCWKKNKEDRPSFREIQMFLSQKSVGYSYLGDMNQLRKNFLKTKETFIGDAEDQVQQETKIMI